MLDLFPARDKRKFHAYMDGRDASLFRYMVNKLGSEERAQNAFILLGLISDEEKEDSLEGRKRANRVKSYFPEYVGATYAAFNAMLSES